MGGRIEVVYFHFRFIVSEITSFDSHSQSKKSVVEIQHHFNVWWFLAAHANIYKYNTRMKCLMCIHRKHSIPIIETCHYNKSI